MLVAVVVAVALTPQLGWKAGTPSPILEGNPRWVELYWKAWENLYAATIDEKEPSPWPSRAITDGEVIDYEKTLAISLYANWGWRAHPIRETLAYVLENVHESGSVPARFGTQGSSGEAGGLPIEALATHRVFALSGDRESLVRHAAGAAARHLYFANRATYTIPPKDEKDKARIGYRVPAALSVLPGTAEFTGEQSAEALGLVLQSTAMLAQVYRDLGDGRSAGTADRMAGNLAKQLGELYSKEDRRFRGTYEGGSERDSMLPLFGAIGGNAPHAETALLGLFDPGRYYRRTLFPLVARTDPAYVGVSGSRPLYTYLAIRAMLDNGMRREAARAAEHVLTVYEAVAGKDNNLYGAYGSEAREPAPGAMPGHLEAGTIVIAALIEAVMGIDVDARAGKVTWFVRRTDKHGLENLRFADNKVSMVFEAGSFTVDCEKPFTLEASVDGTKHLKRFGIGKTVWTPGG
ncbi:MAG: hypothetical protein ABIV13_01710 [Fimbriimonadales bacterium]